jgi:hypothetical protein
MSEIVALTSYKSVVRCLIHFGTHGPSIVLLHTVTIARAYNVPSILKHPLYGLLITPGFKIGNIFLNWISAELMIASISGPNR